MRISIQQLRRIIKEEVQAQSRRLPIRESEEEEMQLEFIFVSPEDEEQYAGLEDEAFVMVCDEPQRCATEFLVSIRREVAGLGRRREDKAILLSGHPDDLTAAAEIFGRLNLQLGASETVPELYEIPDLVQQKMRPLD